MFPRKKLWSAAIACLLLWTAGAEGQLLYSWEGSLEGLVPGGGYTVTNTNGGPNTGVGVTDGADSLQVTIPTEGFQRWGTVTLGAQQLADLQAAAAEPMRFRIGFDVTYDTSFIPQDSVTFINQQIAFQTSSGWSQVNFALLTDGQTNETLRMSAPLSRFSTVKDTISSADVMIASNSDWGAGSAGTIFYDNLAIDEIIPDLNEDGSVNPPDWDIFIGAHLTDLSGLTPSEQFLMGDLDSDFDNDFDDFLIFEAGYDHANGTGALRALIPEPSGCLLLCGGVVLFCRLRRRPATLLVVVALLGLAMPRAAQAQIDSTQLHSWETDLEGWMPFGGAIPSSVATSNIGATDGTQSLGITQDEETFSWAGQVNYGGGSTNFNAIADAVDIGIENFALEFDVTFDTSSIPQDIVTTVSTSVALNSNGGWISYGGVAASDGVTSETIHVSILLDQAINPPSPGSGTLAPRDEAGFYQINFGMDGNWGLDPATFYFDDVQLVQLTEPDVLSIEVNRATGEVLLQNTSTSTSFDFDYYTITSGEGSLDLAGWNSLEEQGVGEWREAGGSSANNLTEASLNGMTTLAPSDTPLSLGNAYDRGVDAQFLTFQYRDLTDPTTLQQGDVFYVGTPPTTSGDFDNNGEYNCLDVDALVQEIVAGTNTPLYDLTLDDVVDGDDLTAWLAEAGAAELPSGNPYLLGDADLDGTVDGADFLIWNANKFTEVAAWCLGDFNANGLIDGADFLIWNNFKFQSSDGIQAVPEPAGGVLALMGLCCWYLARAKR